MKEAGMFPNNVKPYIKTTRLVHRNDSTITEGVLSCCNQNDFEIFVWGKLAQSLFSKLELLPDNDAIIVEARCKKCGRVINLFNSSRDGYEQIGHENFYYQKLRTIDCKRCNKNSFSVALKYEYPLIDELEELGIIELDNAFTWIWIELFCNSCGAVYKSFLDYETS